MTLRMSAQVAVPPDDDYAPGVGIRARDEEQPVLAEAVVALHPQPEQVVEGLHQVDRGFLDDTVLADLDGVVPWLAELLEVQERPAGLQVEHVAESVVLAQGVVVLEELAQLRIALEGHVLEGVVVGLYATDSEHVTPRVDLFRFPVLPL